MNITLNEKGKAEALDFLRANVKAKFQDALDNNFNAWLAEIRARVEDHIPGQHDPVYELGSFYSASGNPELLFLSEEHFDYEEDETE